MPVAGNSLGFPLLTIVVFLPAAAGVACWLVDDERVIRLLASVVAVIDFALSLVLLAMFKLEPVGSAHWTFQFADKTDWISSIGINYWLGVDGVSIFLVALAALIGAIAIIASNFMIADRVQLFCILMLFLQTAILGVFTAINLFLFFVFWEAMLIPSYFLLGMWGEERRVYATVKFVVYTVAGSFLMLVGIFYLWSTTGTLDMAGPNGLIAHPISAEAQTWVFLAFAIAFAIKVPLFPFHTWATTAYTESPTPFLIILAGVMSKAGAFGFLRYCLPLFPHAAQQFSGLISILAIVGMLYAAGLALVQTDIKRLVAYASISHVNLIVLGIFALNATGFDGSVLQMINHSLIISGLFLAVAFIYARTGTRSLSDLGGLGRTRPFLMWLFLIFILAGFDLPGLGSFAGEFLILAGTFQYNAWYASIAALTVILAAWYMIRFFQDTMNGPGGMAPEAVVPMSGAAAAATESAPPAGRLLTGDLAWREAALWIPLLVLILYIGVQPDSLTTRMNGTTNQVTTLVSTTSAPTVSTSLQGGGR